MPRSKRRSSFKGKKIERPCTYELEYVRQDLYACYKCTKDAKGIFSGFCRGCRETCHADHPDQVFELYTKRNFRCDCGNKRAKNTCILYPDKDDFNVGNELCYSHNFEGRYCRCDTEYDAQDAMAQCAMCEDWFHEKCYKTDAPSNTTLTPFEEEYELTCKDCVKKLPVLAEYYELRSAWKNLKKQKRFAGDACIRPKNVSVSTRAGTLDYMWHPGFRLYLCRCSECMELYRVGKAMYIVDKKDFVGPVAEFDDTSIFEGTNGDDIVNDILRESDAQPNTPNQKKTFDDGERIPRKRQTPEKQSKQTLPGEDKRKKKTNSNEALGVHEIMNIRRRITDFLRESIQTNGGNLSRETLLAYMTDLKADMVS